jgi:hypothetical protein
VKLDAGYLPCPARAGGKIGITLMFRPPHLLQTSRNGL